MYLNAGRGNPWAGHSNVADFSLLTVTSNVFTDTPENFGLVLDTGSKRNTNKPSINKYSSLINLSKKKKTMKKS